MKWRNSSKCTHWCGWLPKHPSCPPLPISASFAMGLLSSSHKEVECVSSASFLVTFFGHKNVEDVMWWLRDPWDMCAFSFAIVPLPRQQGQARSWVMRECPSHIHHPSQHLNLRHGSEAILHQSDFGWPASRGRPWANPAKIRQPRHDRQNHPGGHK